MIALLLLQAALGPIGRQALPKDGCAAYLWSVAEPRELVAMAGPAGLRLRIDGKLVDLPRVAVDGPVTLGLAAQGRYAAGEVSATLAMTIAERDDLARGATVSDATLTVTPMGKDAIVTPVGGLVGCG
jgi:hypothetical protein